MMPALLERIRQNCAADPARTAIAFCGEAWTYERLVAEVDRLAGSLRSHGVGADRAARVAVDLPTGPEHVVALLACLSVGATAVPLDPKWSRPQAEVRADLCAAGWSLQADGGAVVLRARDSVTEVRDRAGSPFLLAPTGGTSGTLKAISISESATLARFLTQAVEFGFGRETTFLSATPIFHGGGRSFILSQLYYGGTVVLHPGFDVQDYRRALPHADLAFAVPTMVRRLAADSSRPVPATMLLSGAQSGGDLATVLGAAGIADAHDYYASVEAGPISIRTLRGGELVSTRLAFGVHLPDAAATEPCTEGTTVEDPLVVGHGVADGILDQGGYTAYPETPGRGRGVRMSDRVLVAPGGGIEVLGRTDDVIISGGVNVFPSEVEDALRRLDGITDALVVGSPDREWGEVVSAAICAEPDLDLEQVRTRLREALAGSQIPKRFLTLPALPVTSVGKPDRRHVRTLFSEGGKP